MGQRRRKLARAWADTRRSWLPESLRAAAAGALFYLLLRSGAQDNAELARALLEAVGPVVASGIVAALFFTGEFSVNYLRAGDRLALEDERAAHERTREALKGGATAESGEHHLTPTDFMDLYKGRTQIEAERLVKPHLGKHLTIESTVNDVTKSRSGYLLALKLETDQLIFCHFNGKQWGAQLTVLKRGDAVTVSGDLEAAEQWSLTLKDCKFERR